MAFKLLDANALDALLGKKSASQRHRNVIDFKMPKPIKVGGRNAWLEDEIEAYLRVEIARRDHPGLVKKLSEWIKKTIEAGENPWSVSLIEDWLGKQKSTRH